MAQQPSITCASLEQLTNLVYCAANVHAPVPAYGMMACGDFSAENKLNSIMFGSNGRSSDRPGKLDLPESMNQPAAQLA